jgi:hypothetical protein
MQYISPTSFDLNVTILVVSMVVVGGLGDTAGVLVGALVLSLLPQLTRDYVGLEPVIYGGLLVVIILLLPEGVVPALRNTLPHLAKDVAAAMVCSGSTCSPPTSDPAPLVAMLRGEGHKSAATQALGEKS